MADFSKIGKRSRRKGGDYERKICHILTDYTGVKFRRAPRSGALLREGKINGSFVSGDLICDKDFQFSIECKNRKNINIESVLKSPQTSELLEAWFQCVYDANIASKNPLLFFYMSSVRKDYVATDNFQLFNNVPFMTIGNLNGPFTFTIENKEITINELPNMHIITIDDFKQIDPDLLFFQDII